MTDRPTLIVDATTYAMMHDEPKIIEPTVRIDGDLPNVDTYDENIVWQIRPLRVGDRVTLATKPVVPTGGTKQLPVPFATATVARLRPDANNGGHKGWLVAVSDVEALS